MQRKSSSYQVALAGVVSAACLALMLAGSLLSVFLYIVPAVAGFAIAVVSIEAQRRTAWLTYATVSVLGLLIVPEKEMMLLFVCLFGFYPLLLEHLSALRPKAFSYFCKLLLFNAIIITLYACLLFVFKIPGTVNEFGSYSSVFTVGLLLMGNVTFVVYDIALARCLRVYMHVRTRFVKRVH
ncbi:hypothetical protein LJB77_00965 [Ruminococcaceae bacterium OttesenSCG-928-N02]|nr:hypothetical protein [Ruminococcaceae bacterium OttesenSCG-928-N02]